MGWRGSESLDPRQRSREQRMRRFKQVPVRFLLPNLITLLAMCAGVTAIRLGIEGRFELAVAGIIIAILLDALDGRIARLLKGTSRFGAELDSLADFVDFGVAPAVLLYLWSLHELKSLGWIVCLVLAICCALRLARFNVALDDPDRPAYMANFFTGVPAPAGAGLALLPLFLGFLGVIPNGPAAAWFILPYVAVIGFLMVSKVPTLSGKTLGSRISRDVVLPVLLVMVLFIAVLASFPWQVLTALAAAYLVMLPLGYRSYLRQRAAHRRAAAPEEPGSAPET
ncbi:CDP-diacylglycerol--serine O-phosphatidyltransferase [Rhodoligotrophos appendicifer]|uniref:CDP-diacylglycerol--serine O-phosphatidyltransferase n=1 Tax=Rhodoligotrophos appendicifer TaxID=987056 RepID=UPI001185AFF8|nr:CDP-diacylglycerol--serine O-phosphatidyltransferase [Rhodoligotrophos appendicifer]